MPLFRSRPRGGRPLLLTYRLVFACWIVLAIWPSLSTGQAAWAPGGVPICSSPCVADGLHIAAAPDGGAFILWRGITLSNFIWRPFVQRIGPDGSVPAGWPVNGVQIGRDSTGLRNFSIAGDGLGNVYLAWATISGSDVYLQRLTSTGTVSAGWPADGLLICGAPGVQDVPALIADSAGAFVVWEDSRTFYDIYGTRILADGSRAPGWPVDGLPICTAPGEQWGPRAASDGAGGFFASWGLDRRTVPDDFYVVRFGPEGNLAPGWQVNGNRYVVGSRNKHTESLAADGTGGLFISWNECVPSTSTCDVFLLRIASDGQIAPGWPARGVPISASPGSHGASKITLDGFGGVIMSWDTGGDIYGQRVHPDGTLFPGWPVGGRFVGGESNGGVAADGRGGAYFSYERYFFLHEVHVQHLDGTSGVMPGWEGGIPVLPGALQTEPVIVADGSGGAIVAWEDGRVLNSGAIYAQKYVFDGPTATLLSLVSAEAQPDRVALVWHRSGSDVTDATVYRRTDSVGWLPIGHSAFDGSGVLRHEDRSVTPGRRYAYRLGVRENGTETFSDEVWVDVPAALQFALDGLRPNPANGPLRVAFTLPRPGRASLELLDVSGRAVVRREVGGLGPGRHLITIGNAGEFAPSIYWLKLTTGERALIARAAIVR